MTLMMEIECGTWVPQEIEIDIDSYSKVRPVNVSPEKHKEAYDLLRATLNDVTFADDGCRNEDAVNSLIALHVLGYDVEEWIGNFLDDMLMRSDSDKDAFFFKSDLITFKDHVDRVLPYLDSWGPEGHEADALDYAINW